MPPRNTSNPYIVALTGGIATGKSAVSDRFAELGVPVIDTDRIAHELVEPGKPLLEQVAAAFGHDLLDAQGRLDRRRLRRMVFADDSLRRRLEGILHPAIREATQQRIEALDSAYCLVVIPLLAESGPRDWIDRVLVVDAAPNVQVDRVVRRDHVSREEADSVLAAQASRGERLALADDVIDNSGDLADLDPQIEALHAKYLALAAGKPKLH